MAIGVAGVWAVAATLAKKKWKKRSKQHYPMVSFVVSAYNEEKNVSRCINSLFRCAEMMDCAKSLLLMTVAAILLMRLLGQPNSSTAEGTRSARAK
ncbi:MAG: glycosyltransferase [Candidatus Bathyarchaeota archaeon]|nr:glycosyltransferase [Candidatus Bathyarchaeota archaeon]